MTEKKGSKGGAVVRTPASSYCGPGSIRSVDAICGLSLLLVLSFAPRGFSPGTPVFPSPQKPAFPNSNSTRNQVNEEPLCKCATSKSLFTLLYLILNVLSHVRFRRIDVRCKDTAKDSYENNLDIELFVRKNESCPL